MSKVALLVSDGYLRSLRTWQLKIYRQAVMKEAMRMHPGVGFPLERLVPEGGVMISGVNVPAGTNISMSAPVMHFDKNVFGQDAGQFRPERWIEADAEQLKMMNRSFLAVSLLRLKFRASC